MLPVGSRSRLALQSPDRPRGVEDMALTGPVTVGRLRVDPARRPQTIRTHTTDRTSSGASLHPVGGSPTSAARSTRRTTKRRPSRTTGSPSRPLEVRQSRREALDKMTRQAEGLGLRLTAHDLPQVSRGETCKCVRVGSAVLRTRGRASRQRVRGHCRHPRFDHDRSAAGSVGFRSAWRA